jgi:hypothetical protein
MGMREILHHEGERKRVGKNDDIINGGEEKQYGRK